MPHHTWLDRETNVRFNVQTVDDGMSKYDAEKTWYELFYYQVPNHVMDNWWVYILMFVCCMLLIVLFRRKSNAARQSLNR